MLSQARGDIDSRLFSLFSGGSSRLLGLLCSALLIANSIASRQAMAEDTHSLTSLSQHGYHFETLISYITGKKEPRGISELLAAGRSAWALGLVDNARRIWREVLANPEFDGIDRTRTMLSQAILELQEENPEEARRLAEVAARSLAPSELRGQLWLVIAESLRMQGACSLAEEYYRKAIAESEAESKNEALFLLGECELKLGLLDNARYTFAEIPSGSAFAGRSIRRLMEIDFQQRHYDGVLAWAGEGSRRAPADFDDPWVNYEIVISLIRLKRLDAAEQELKRFSIRHTTSDLWYLLAEGALEGARLQHTSLKGNEQEERTPNPTMTREKKHAPSANGTHRMRSSK